MGRLLLAIAALLVFAGEGFAQSGEHLLDTGENHPVSVGYSPPDGFVPDAFTAVAVAEAILTPIYRAKTIASERPFKAVLHDGVWFVTGTLPRSAAGGTAEVH